MARGDFATDEQRTNIRIEINIILGTYSQLSATRLCPNSTRCFICMREYLAEKSSIVQFLPTKIRVVAPSRVLPIPRSVVGSQPQCMRRWLCQMKNGAMPLLLRHLANLGKLEGLTMFRLQR